MRRTEVRERRNRALEMADRTGVVRSGTSHPSQAVFGGRQRARLTHEPCEQRLAALEVSSLQPRFGHSQNARAIVRRECGGALEQWQRIGVSSPGGFEQSVRGTTTADPLARASAQPDRSRRPRPIVPTRAE